MILKHHTQHFKGMPQQTYSTAFKYPGVEMLALHNVPFELVQGRLCVSPLYSLRGRR